MVPDSILHFRSKNGYAIFQYHLDSLHIALIVTLYAFEVSYWASTNWRFAFRRSVKVMSKAMWFVVRKLSTGEIISKSANQIVLLKF